MNCALYVLSTITAVCLLSVIVNKMLRVVLLLSITNKDDNILQMIDFFIVRSYRISSHVSSGRGCSAFQRSLLSSTKDVHTNTCTTRSSTEWRQYYMFFLLFLQLSYRAAKKFEFEFKHCPTSYFFVGLKSVEFCRGFSVVLKILSRGRQSNIDLALLLMLLLQNMR